MKLPKWCIIIYYCCDSTSSLLDNPNRPEHVLKPASPMLCLEYNPKDLHTLAGGCYNGQLGETDDADGKKFFFIMCLEFYSQWLSLLIIQHCLIQGKDHLHGRLLLLRSVTEIHYTSWSFHLLKQVCISFEQKKEKKCRNPGSNQGPLDLQSNALPTELFRHVYTSSRLNTGVLVTALYFLKGSDVFSTSTDGQVLWWDIRKLVEPVETLSLEYAGYKAGEVLGGITLEYESTMVRSSHDCEECWSWASLSLTHTAHQIHGWYRARRDSFG